MNLSRTLSHGEEDGAIAGAGSGKPTHREEWMERWLPLRGFERTAYLVLAALTLGLKVLAIYRYRIDSDETQHAHVVWGWVTGQLQYRDIFDNHMPLFQALCAPVMALLGERADIMMMLRWAMAPLYLVCLWAVYELTELLYSRRAAAWSALIAGGLGLFFSTSTEFRTDDLWAAFWLVGLVVAVRGAFTMKRAICFGLMAGLMFAVSLKTVVLLAGMGTATTIAMLMALVRGEPSRLAQSTVRGAAAAMAMLIPPAATVAYFAWRGAFWIMYYCVISHNIVPRLKRWGHFSLHEWNFPAALVALIIYGWLIFVQTPSTRLAIRRTVIALTPWCFLALLTSYWPDITREDNLPYAPLAPLSLIPLIMLAGGLVKNEEWRKKFWTYVLPAVALCNLAWTFKVYNFRSDRAAITTRSIADVLALTSPEDYVIDNKGDYVFRRRAYYWVLEPITKARVRMGLIHDSIPQRIMEKGVKVCYLRCSHGGSIAGQFIAANYVPFDREALDIGVLGKVIGSGATEGSYSFDIVIPQTYAVVTENGDLAGQLDGKPYAGPVWLTKGKHEFQRTRGSGRAGIILASALQNGFTLPFADAERIAKEVATLPPERMRKGPEEQ